MYRKHSNAFHRQVACLPTWGGNLCANLSVCKPEEKIVASWWNHHNGADDADGVRLKAPLSACGTGENIPGRLPWPSEVFFSSRDVRFKLWRCCSGLFLLVASLCQSDGQADREQGSEGGGRWPESRHKDFDRAQMEGEVPTTWALAG